jgi:hypothetical protein
VVDSLAVLGLQMDFSDNVPGNLGIHEEKAKQHQESEGDSTPATCRMLPTTKHFISNRTATLFRSFPRKIHLFLGAEFIKH